MNNKFDDFWIRAGPSPSNFDEFQQNAVNLLTLAPTSTSKNIRTHLGSLQSSIKIYQNIELS
jgi:hypothetical protein